MLHSINLVSITFRILLSIIIGGALGIERGRKRHPAGFRTYILVCLGSTLVMMTNQYIFQTFQTGDVSRLGAQVISGIGFLGAGTIIITGRNQVKGLTTAAGLWAAACIGLAIGIGFYEGAIICGVTTFFVMTILHNLDESMRKKLKQINLYVELDASFGLGSFISYAKKNSIQLSDIQVVKNQLGGKEETAALLSAKAGQNQSHEDVIETLGLAPGLNYIEEV